VHDPSNFFPESFTVILEYKLPAQSEEDVRGWARLWHELSSLPFPSESYNAALEGITQRFSRRGAAPGGVNDSALFRLRTNEVALSFPWELREFELSRATGFFHEVPVKETPDLQFNATPTFSAFVNQNEAAIIGTVPGASGNLVSAAFQGQPFQAGSALNNGQTVWGAPGIANPEARFHASMNTCNGCHGPDTGSFDFTIISPRSRGSEAQLSPFLTGTTVFDRFSGQTRTLNDLARRKADLTSIVCSTDGGAAPPFDAGTQAPLGCTSPERVDAAAPETP